MKSNNNHIIAEKGKVFRRISDQKIFGSEMWLGYTWYLNGVRLDYPLLETPEDYEEIDEPDEYEPEEFNPNDFEGEYEEIDIENL